MNKTIDVESKIISSFIGIVIIVLLTVIFLGETEISSFVKQTKVGKKGEATTSFEYGLEYLKNQNYNGAIHSLTKAIRLDSEFSQAYTNLAIAYAKSGKNDKAINDKFKATRGK